MRPVPDITVSRSRKTSIEHPQQWIDPRSTAPTTFFLSRHSHGPDSDELSPQESDPSRESMYGVQSLHDAANPDSLIASLCESEQSTASNQPAASDPTGTSAVLPEEPVSPKSTLEEKEEKPEEDGACRPFARRHSTLKPFDAFLNADRLDTSLPASGTTSPRPLTPLDFSNPDDGSSLPSSPKSISNHSMRHLDEISITDGLSQAVASGDEDNESRFASNEVPSNISQLIMPIIKMPSRRPFTERGKALGRLKVLFAGVTGSGKASLIKSIVQECEDIVHVDALPTTPPSPRLQASGPPSRPSRNFDMSSYISEIYASTKPYPTWWSDLEDSRVLRRRKSTGDVVLERNLCFAYTPKSALSRAGQTDAILQYIRQQLVRATTSLHHSNHDFENLLAGNGGAQVDAVLYLISTDTLSTDIECIRKLCEWTSVIPIISKSDLLTVDQVSDLKTGFRQKARDAGVHPFCFGDSSLSGSDIQVPFAVSSAKSNDEDEMDASTLMSPDYVQPLVPSELPSLVQKLFDPENLAFIRHSTAKKLAQRQQEQVHRRQGALNPGLLSFSPASRPHSPGYTMARISDYTSQEEKVARVHLAKWASDLQQSLQNERERYAALSRGERAVWLTERLGECVVDGSLVPITQTPGFCGLRGPGEQAGGGGLVVRTKQGQKVEYQFTRISPDDPLGLVWWSEDLKRRGWTIVQIVGSFGVVGGLALWLAKSWGLPSRSLSEWRFDWHSID